jgi:peptide/nickel transport system ATP-binding protein
MEKLIDVRDLVVRFYTYEGIVKALEGVNLDIRKGETLGLVGETGCGKSVTALSILLLTPPPGKIEGGKVLLRRARGYVDLLRQDEAFMRKIRGSEISMIFQEPSAALNPVYTVDDQVSEVFLVHRREELCKKVLEGIEDDIRKIKGRLSPKKMVLKWERGIYRKMLKKPNSLLLKVLQKIPIVRRYQRRLKAEARKMTVQILREMEIPNPEDVVNRYPHELSGGMQQRVVIAMALACSPRLLIADEPTTSLDVTTQAQILDLVRKLKREFGSSVLYITHNLGVVAEMCDRVGVMYAGDVCELAGVRELFKNPLHPYTKALFGAIPKPGKKLQSIGGTVPNLIDPPTGCRFHPRCPKLMDICPKVVPKMKEVRKGHFVACHLYSK